MQERTAIDRREFLAGSAAGATSLAMAGRGSVQADDSLANRPAAPLAMWAMTGQLESDNVRRQLDQYAAVGWGMVLYPRWGLEIEYLGDQWFERVRFIVEQAAERAVEIWLYDEFCWPSGHAKGIVTRDHPNLAAELLEVDPDGQSRLIRIPESANLLMREATDRFLHVTHDRYAEALEPWLGSTVRAIFTDEPSLAMQHHGRPGKAASWLLPWSAAMNTALGGDFRNRLADQSDPAAWSGWRDYWAAYSQTFHDNWVEPIAAWCQKHGIAMTGHLLGEGSFGSQVAYNGSLRRQLASFGLPGIDEISTRTEPAKCEALTLSAIAELVGHERMVEAYALGPPYMRLDTMQKMVNLCSACGVDRYVLAICPHDLRGGIYKREYLGIHSPVQPWFSDYAKIYTEHVAEAAVRARAAKPLGVPWPSDEELWAVAGPDPRRSKPLAAMTAKVVAAAREVIASRLAPPATVLPRADARQPDDIVWAFEPLGLNSVRLDGPTLNVVDLPAKAELSVQVQLVRSLKVNGTSVDWQNAPVDTDFDLSFHRVPIARLLKVGENRIEVDMGGAKPLKFLPALVLWGDFAVDADGRLVAQPKTLPLGDWRQHGYPAFCGTGRYRATIEFDEPPKRLAVDTGGYPVHVLWNGSDLGRRGWPPFDFDLGGAARRGENQIVIEVTSTLGHLFVPASSPPIGLLALRFES